MLAQVTSSGGRVGRHRRMATGQRRRRAGGFTRGAGDGRRGAGGDVKQGLRGEIIASLKRVLAFGALPVPLLQPAAGVRDGEHGQHSTEADRNAVLGGSHNAEP